MAADFTTTPVSEILELTVVIIISGSRKPCQLAADARKQITYNQGPFSTSQQDTVAFTSSNQDRPKKPFKECHFTVAWAMNSFQS
mmetsp:Transcript_9886/g.14873  ORF Transcript_9886/g.14873 Transcript_9886/m.14873 type:complete len:85 (-) Transcript_9886:100-354(-)